MKKLILLLLFIPLASFGQTWVFNKYFENGQLDTEASFKNGKQVGLLKFYYQSGQLQEEHFYKNDQLNGQGTYTYADGEIVRGIWKNGELETAN